MDQQIILNVVYPPGHGAASKEKAFQLTDTIAELVATAIEGTTLEAAHLMVVAEANGSAQYLNASNRLKEFNLSQKVKKGEKGGKHASGGAPRL